MSIYGPLVELARAKSLVSPFEEWNIGWLAVLRPGQAVPDFVQCDLTAKVPIRTFRTANANPNLLYDTVQFTVGVAWDDKKKKFAPTKSGVKKVLAFWEFAAKAVGAVGDAESLELVKAFLNHVSTAAGFAAVQKAFITAAAKAGDTKGAWMAVAAGDPENVLAVHPAISAWWASIYEKAGSVDGTDICCTTGVSCEAVKVMSKVASVPGTGGKASLSSYDKPTFQYAGRKQGMNYPTSPDVDRCVQASLEWLMKESDLRWHNSAVRLDDRTVVAIWSKHMDLGCFVHVLDSHAYLFPKGSDPSDVAIEATKDAAWAAVASLSESEEEAEILVLRGSRARISVLGHETTTVGAVARNLVQARKAVLGRFGWNLGKFWDSVVPSKSSAASRLAGCKLDVFLSLLSGRPFDEMTAGALVSIFPEDPEKLWSWIDLMNLKNGKDLPMPSPASPTTRPDFKDFIPPGQDTAFYCGALAVALGTLQKQSQGWGDVQDEVKRIVPMIMKNPTILAPFLSRAESHDAKVERHHMDPFYVRTVQDVEYRMARAAMQAGRFPERFTVQEQATFHMGKSCMREYLKRRQDWRFAQKAQKVRDPKALQASLTPDESRT